MKYELGVIGGMGSLATEVFFKYIVENTKAEKDQDHINTIILNHASLPDRTTAILNNDYSSFLSEIKEDFDLLNGLNLKAIAIPCNTAHFFYDEYLKFTSTPIINMVEESIKAAVKLGYPSLTVLATTGTHSAGVYKKYADKYGVKLVDQDKADMEKVMEIIYSVKAGKLDFTEFISLINKYREFGGVVLACTELSTIDIGDVEVIDALKILGDKCIEACQIEPKILG